LIGAALRHFFPSQVGISFNKSRDFAQKLAQTITTGAQERYFYDPEFRGTTIAEHTVTRLAAIIAEMFSSTAEFDGVTRDRFLRRLQEKLPAKEMPAVEFVERLQDLFRADPRVRNFLRTSMAEKQDEIEKIIIGLASPEEKYGFDFGLPRMISAAADQAATFFQNSVGYLGPLRDEPRPVYPLEALVNLTDVGYRGEHTAAVLDLHKDRPVTYIPSRSSNDLVDAQRESVSLHAAVVDWLVARPGEYLGSLAAATVWQHAEDAIQLHLAISLEVANAHGISLEALPLKGIPNFCIGSEFLPSLHLHGGLANGTLANIVRTKCAQVLASKAQAAPRSFKECRSGDKAESFRVHLSKDHEAFRLMYWTRPDGSTEFANIGAKAELLICEGDFQTHAAARYS
jgi:hypothetical protein